MRATKERLDFVRAGLRGYEALNERSKERTTRAEWIALKLNCTEQEAQALIRKVDAGAGSPPEEPESEPQESASMRVKTALDLGRRQSLLARMAGNIAGGLASNSFYVDGVNARLDHEAIEAEAVAMAERILKRIGL